MFLKKILRQIFFKIHISIRSKNEHFIRIGFRANNCGFNGFHLWFLQCSVKDQARQLHKYVVILFSITPHFKRSEFCAWIFFSFFFSCFFDELPKFWSFEKWSVKRKVGSKLQWFRYFGWILYCALEFAASSSDIAATLNLLCIGSRHFTQFFTNSELGQFYKEEIIAQNW